MACECLCHLSAISSLLLKLLPSSYSMVKEIANLFPIPLVLNICWEQNEEHGDLWKEWEDETIYNSSFVYKLRTGPLDLAFPIPQLSAETSGPLLTAACGAD